MHWLDINMNYPSFFVLVFYWIFSSYLRLWKLWSTQYLTARCVTGFFSNCKQNEDNCADANTLSIIAKTPFAHSIIINQIM